MDGKGAWRDNVFVERFWRTIKYEEVYLHAYDGVGQARQSIGRYIAFYNTRRRSSAGRRQPQRTGRPGTLRSTDGQIPVSYPTTSRTPQVPFADRQLRIMQVSLSSVNTPTM